MTHPQAPCSGHGHLWGCLAGLWCSLTSSLLSRAEQLASLEAAQRAVGVIPGASAGSNSRAEFWRLRGLRRGAKKTTHRSREDLSALTKQGHYPPYERVVLREGGPGWEEAKGLKCSKATILTSLLPPQTPTFSYLRTKMPCHAILSRFSRV